MSVLPVSADERYCGSLADIWVMDGIYLLLVSTC